MGNCLGTEILQENQFRVKNINDDKRLVQKGLMEVTLSDLMYTDSKTSEIWQWPLKYLRKYGCDGDVFSFEAGRKCPGGEGLYAFSTPKASQLFDLVARNITQDNSHPPENLSPLLSAEEQDHSALTFPPGTQTQPPDLPNYTNVPANGAIPLSVQTEIGGGMTTDTSRESSVPKPDSPPPIAPVEPPKCQYREVVFQKPPEEHPAPVNETNERTTYLRIDFEETQKRSVQRNGALQVTLPVAYSHSRVSTSSAPGDRRRMNTFPASTSKHSISSGSLSSQNSLTESVRETRSPHVNGGVPQSAGVTPEQMTYQNLLLGASGQLSTYANISVGRGDASHLASPPSQQPNYANLPSSATKSRAISSPSIVGRVPLPEVHGHPMAHYAELELSSTHQRTSTPRDHHHHESSYLQLGFTHSTPNPSSLSPTTTPIPEGRTSPEATRLELQPPPLTSSTRSTSTGRIPMPKLVDDKVNYGVLDFDTMNVLSEMQRQREQDNKEREELQAKKNEKMREKEKSSTQRRHTHHK